MAWAAIDDGLYDDPRIIDAGLQAAGLYACSIAYCARHLTDGVVPKKVIWRMLELGDDQPVRDLVRVGLWKEIPGGDFEVVGYADGHNLPREEVLRRRASYRVRAKKASHARWEKERAKERQQAEAEDSGEFSSDDNAFGF